MKRLIDYVRSHGKYDERVLAVMGNIPRELFVPKAMAVDAYDDACLPIGEQQTISMPSVVAAMTSALELTGNEKVLEIGTGCGYQTSILCRLCKRVYTIERLKGLSTTAVQRLSDMGFTNYTPMVGDGTLGWPAQAPFDKIIVTAAGPWVPSALVEQLKVGGTLVIPVGTQEERQKLVKVVKTETGTEETVIGTVSFVPLVGEQGVKLRA
ncbi:MAG: protein-L-isoaspartate(D-aspartate) O-methyltransferase [Alphaproteobacteria bacterium]|nr:MAG: protein-L-isoaspartate(D-aspartate) O-methyltransferase [Alphaproteobacteria bacterium]